MKNTQKKIFFDYEGDSYYKRNKQEIFKLKVDSDIPIRILEMYKIIPKRVLEIGCMNGYRLNFIYEKYGSICKGIEPSKDAVEEGKKLYKNITLERGIFSEIPFNESFDLIIINFVFHWIDRDLLAKCISEVERILIKGGFLIIGDFFPDVQKKTKYSHLPNEDIWTYKQDYSKIFLILGTYSLIALFTSSFKAYDFVFEPNDNERKFYALLWKRDIS